MQIVTTTATVLEVRYVSTDQDDVPVEDVQLAGEGAAAAFHVSVLRYRSCFVFSLMSLLYPFSCIRVQR